MGHSLVASWGRLILFLSQACLCHAQSLAVSSTAAWSSQIIAFWGAVLVGVRASEPGRINNPLSFAFCVSRIIRRTTAISSALRNDNWFMHSGWNNGRLRLDIAIITWSDSTQLSRLARRVAAQIEAMADNWEVLVVGLKVDGNTEPATATWIKCTRSLQLSNIKTQETNEDLFPLGDDDISEAMRMMTQEKSSTDEIVEALAQRCDRRASRPAYQDEVAKVVDGIMTDPSWARHFTALNVSETPYAYAEVVTGVYGSGQHGTTTGYIRLYALVHLAVAVAIGLMGAASGRGLAVWIMVLRVSMSSLGADKIPGSDYLLSLISIDGCTYSNRMPAGSDRLAGDVVVGPMPWWVLAATAAVALLEILIVGAGWLYGAMNAQRLRPTGVVGHGMLALSVFTAVCLSMRVFFSIRQRCVGHNGKRLIGIWKTAHGIRLAMGFRSLVVPVDKILSSPVFSTSELALITTVIRQSKADNRFVVESLMRHPCFASLLSQFLVCDVIQYRYGVDDIISRGNPPIPVRAPNEYPWIQSCICIIFPLLACCVSALYAYYPLPLWVKLITEISVAFGAMYFSTLERVTKSGLLHSRDSYLSFLVSSLVVCSVWYVGVQDVG